ncbi:hypothetical protein Btru_015461, partial [Bulinus truncatus]
MVPNVLRGRFLKSNMRLTHSISLTIILLLVLITLTVGMRHLFPWVQLNERSQSGLARPGTQSNVSKLRDGMRLEHNKEKDQTRSEQILTTDQVLRKDVQVTTGSHETDENESFGPEKGLYNFTVVTATLDIGRGSWKHQNRAYDQYLQYMKGVLRLDVNLVLFIDAKGKSFVEKMRRGRERRTKIIVTSLAQLPYY